jgi:hypothetical protein
MTTNANPSHILSRFTGRHTHSQVPGSINGDADHASHESYDTNNIKPDRFTDSAKLVASDPYSVELGNRMAWGASYNR